MRRQGSRLMKKLRLLNWLLVWSLAPLGGAWGAFVLTPESAELENVTVPVREAFALLESGDVAAGVAGFLKAAESGDKDGQFAMGYVTAGGTGVEQSRERGDRQPGALFRPAETTWHRGHRTRASRSRTADRA